ncbi:MAG: hypothetical protein AAFX85_14475 [Pseudomonadota bacterium]
MARIALLTCRELPEPDPDEEITVAALREAGHEAELLAWNAPDRAPDAYDLCILRSTWDYIWHVDAFIRYLAEVDRASVLCNPLDVVRWNLHKGYLATLAAAGVAVTPTWHVGRGSQPARQQLTERGWGGVVIKPAISAGSFGTRRFEAGSESEAHDYLMELSAQADVLVQPYIQTVEEGGERALVCIDGEITHGIVKAPRFSGEDEHVSVAYAPSPAEEAFARQALAALPGSLGEHLLYARVDVFDDGEGGLLLSELELIEPSLFFLQQPSALAAFVAATQRRLT